MTQPADLITTAEAAVILGVTSRHAQRLIGPEGLVPVKVTSLGFLFDRAQVLRFVERRAEKAAS